MKSLTAWTAAAAFALSAVAAQAQPGSETVDEAPSGAAMAVDLVVVRPLSLAMTVVGAGIYVLQLPLALIQMDFGTPAKKLVAEPAAYTFARPLGELE